MPKIIKKSLIVTSLLVITAQLCASAANVVSETKLNDGSYIRKCRFNNGVIDYCGTLDAVNAMRAINDLSLTATPQQLKEMKNQENAYRAERENEAKQYITKLSVPTKQLDSLSDKEFNEMQNYVMEAQYFLQDNKNFLSDNTQNVLKTKITEYKTAIDEETSKREARQDLVNQVKDGIKSNFKKGDFAVNKFNQATKFLNTLQQAK